MMLHRFNDNTNYEPSVILLHEIVDRVGGNNPPGSVIYLD